MGEGDAGARDQILGSIRKSLKRGPLGEAAAGALVANMAAPKRNLIPARAQSLDHAGQVDLFQRMAEEVQTTVVRIGGMDELPDAVAEYLSGENLPSEITMAPDPALDAAPWEKRPLLSIRRGKAEPSDLVSLTPCFAAVAETGTLMLTSGPQTPTTLNFLPDTHVVVVKRSQVVGTYEEGWTRLRAAHGAGVMPRTVNFITGPSRTGDIEQRIQLGAHGPRRLHIVIVDDEKPRDGEAA